MTNRNSIFHILEDADACRRGSLPASVCWRNSGSITFKSLFFFSMLPLPDLWSPSPRVDILGFPFRRAFIDHIRNSVLPCYPACLYGQAGLCSVDLWGSSAEIHDRSRNESINKNRPWMIFACGKTIPLLRTTPPAEVYNYVPLNNWNRCPLAMSSSECSILHHFICQSFYMLPLFQSSPDI